MQGDYTLKHGIFITPIGRLPAHRAVAPGAGTARGASLRFACRAAGSFAQQFWSWRPVSFCHALAEAAYLHATKNLGWLVPAGTICDWARRLDDVFLSDATRTSARFSLNLSTAASIPTGSRCGGRSEVQFAGK